jgi:hypothetical protein
VKEEKTRIESCAASSETIGFRAVELAQTFEDDQGRTFLLCRIFRGEVWSHTRLAGST